MDFIDDICKFITGKIPKSDTLKETLLQDDNFIYYEAGHPGNKRISNK